MNQQHTLSCEVVHLSRWIRKESNSLIYLWTGEWTVKPRINRDKLKGIVVRCGATVRFDVDVRGEPAPTMEWIFAGTTLDAKTHERVKIENEEHNTKIALSDTVRKDTGIYTLTAVNSVGKDEATVEITILGKPSRPEGPLQVTDVHKEGCKLKWDKPKDDGGLPVSGYIIEKMEPGTGRSVFTFFFQSMSCANYFSINELCQLFFNQWVVPIIFQSKEIKWWSNVCPNR